ncbi:Sit4p protein phosphatase associating protein [Komagataella phaffii CBS 7435]|uniref:Protein that forms a complex with the Sit4p protein phosphatase n=2 Tax=Komagataella phaffii TaxID=460519 RepID=C4QVC2_KOMPG|nr:Protein that forms a complex with the Sit4p protein phosphatase [Komagataella phaffii GS115]AOA60478.1 GQ67_02389T0 [Komagataella phaffii]CAH2445850.1 Sit4p protein phosphatase associating protein [Komagataella phaffii CBS 7435]AOA66646.1 GQ68_02858T0 [Komagataella phaffii GS115]CAY67195.1 Protein that forms a complex with the Sit4p protein phosphatase [Komagataella phaffii GS115]CCA36304.1 Sit4p protein phosphatase associating protein [Komagataella phaffii CBS 7435]
MHHSSTEVSAIWPFFNNSYSNVAINKILQEIENEEHDNDQDAGLTAVQLLQTIRENDDIQKANDTQEPTTPSRSKESKSNKSSKTTSSGHLNKRLLNNLLIQPNLINELNAGKNSKLIAYITQEKVLSTLIDYCLESLDLKTDYVEDIDDDNEDDFNEDGSPVGHDEEEITFQYDEDNNTGKDNEKAAPADQSDSSSKRLLKRATIAMHILSSDQTPVVYNQFLSSHQYGLISKIWEGVFNRDIAEYFIDKRHNIVMMNGFIAIIENLAEMNVNGLMNFIRFQQTKDSDSLSKHFVNFIPYFPQFSDLLLKLISMDKPYNPIGLIELLVDQDLIGQILEKLRVYYDDCIIQDNLLIFLNGLVNISSNVGYWDDQQNNMENEMNDGNNGSNEANISAVNGNNTANIGPNDLTRDMVSTSKVNTMINIILNYGDYGLVTCISLFIEIIRKNNSDYDEFDWIMAANDLTSTPNSRDPIYLGVMLKLFIINLPAIVNKYLTDEYYERKQELNTFSSEGQRIDFDGKIRRKMIVSSIGKEIEPLGYERFKIMELIAELLHCSNMMLLNQSSKLDYLLFKRDELRRANQTEKLVHDALTDSILKPVEDAIEDLKIADDTSLHSFETLKKIDSKYIECTYDLSVGNSFKFSLLVSQALPRIILKMDKFPWNNFMHNVIFDLVQQIFNGKLIDDTEGTNDDENQDGDSEAEKSTEYEQNTHGFEDPLCFNKLLIVSLFGEYDAFDQDLPPDGRFARPKEIPGSFNLPAYILYACEKSKLSEEQANVKLGYMGHLVLVAQEVVKFQSIIENFGIHKEQLKTRKLEGEEIADETDDDEGETEDTEEEEQNTENGNTYDTVITNSEQFSSIKGDLPDIYKISSTKIYTRLYKQLCTSFGEGRFQKWTDFINNELSVVREQYNQVLGGVNEGEVEIDEVPRNPNAIVLDNGDSEEFRKPFDEQESETETEDEESEEEENNDNDRIREDEEAISDDNSSYDSDE